MRLYLRGFDSEIVVGEGLATQLVIESPMLMSRVVQSLVSEAGEFALEPYSLWTDGGGEVKSKGALFCVTDPFQLPWDHRVFVSGLLQRVDSLIMEDDESRIAIEALGSELRSRLAGLGFSLNSDYGFSVEWDAQKFLKAFGYKVETNADDRLLDSLIKFLALSSDVGLNKPLVFVCLQNFLSIEDRKVLVEQAIFYGISLLMLESRQDDFASESLRKYVIDQHLLEY